MVNPTVFFDIAVDGEPLGRVSFEVGAGGDEPGGPERAAGGERLSNRVRAPCLRNAGGAAPFPDEGPFWEAGGGG